MQGAVPSTWEAGVKKVGACLPEWGEAVKKHMNKIMKQDRV